MINTFKEIFKELDICRAWIVALGIWTVILTVILGFLVCGEFKKILNDNDVQIVDIREIQLEKLDVPLEPIE